MKSQLIAIVAAVLLVGCGDPEAEANKLFTEASQLVKDADAITEPYSLEACNKRKAAVELLEKITVQYPQSSLSVRISEGDFKIQSQLIDEIMEKMKPNISIHQAASVGHIKAVKQHIAAGTDVNAKGRAGQTPLHEAALNGRKEVAALLIAKGADVNAKGRGFGGVAGQTPLHAAALAASENEISKALPVGHYRETVELLIANGADVDMRDSEGNTPLDMAVINRAIANLLRKHGGKTSDWLKAGESIHVAAKAGHIEAVKQHLAAGADLNAKANDGVTPLGRAIKFNNTELADLLRKHGGKAKAPDISINKAAEKGNIEAVNHHIAAGTDVNAKNWQGQTPLHFAADGGYKEIVERLIAVGADVNAEANNGDTPLDVAIRYDETDIADLLRKHGGKTEKELKAEGK